MMALLGAAGVALFIVVAAAMILGILYLTIEISKKITARRLKNYIRNEQRLEGAARAVIHDKDGKSVKVTVLNENDTAFAELTVTGKSTSFLLRDGRTIKVK